VLALEDLQWADPSTLELLAALARRGDPARLLVVATYREWAPGELRALAADLRLHGHATGLALAPLDAEALEALVVSRGGAASLAGTLHRRTGGNPLFALGLLEAGGEPDRLPATLAELLEAEIAALDPAEQRLLEACAVAGASFAAAALDVEDAEARCAALARRHRFLRPAGTEEWPDGTVSERFAFDHDLRREALRDRLPAGRRCELHRRIGARLEAGYGPRARAVAAELAAHFVAGRDPGRAVVHLRAAAEVAAERGALVEAAEQLTLAAELAADPEQELAIQVALAPALAATRGWDAPEAAAAYRRARELCEQLGARDELSRVLYGLATLEEYRANYAVSQALIEERLRLDGSEPDRGLESYELLACSLFHQGAFAQALASADQAIAAQGRSAAACALGEDPESSSHGCAALALWFLGKPDDALARANAAIELVRDPGRSYGLAGALAHAARVHQHRGEPEAVRERAGECSGRRLPVLRRGRADAARLGDGGARRGRGRDRRAARGAGRLRGDRRGDGPPLLPRPARRRAGAGGTRRRGRAHARRRVVRRGPAGLLPRRAAAAAGRAHRRRGGGARRRADRARAGRGRAGTPRHVACTQPPESLHVGAPRGWDRCPMPTTTMINGVDVSRLVETLNVAQQTPEAVRFEFRAHNAWLDGGHNRSTISSFDVGGAPDTARTATFVLENDEPDVLLGADRAANPVEYILHALAGCLTTTLVYHAAARGVAIRAVECRLEGDLDLRGFLGVADVRRGYEAVRVAMRVEADADETTLDELVATAQKHSPVFDIVSNGLPVAVRRD